MEFLRGYPASDEEAFSTWLKRTGQTERAIRHFWEPVVVGALNDSFDRCSTRYAGQVFYESFLRNPEGGRLGIPSQPLSSFYAAFARLAQGQGTDVRLRSSVERIERTAEGLWRVWIADGTSIEAPQLLLALPLNRLRPCYAGWFRRAAGFKIGRGTAALSPRSHHHRAPVVRPRGDGTRSCRAARHAHSVDVQQEPHSQP